MQHTLPRSLGVTVSKLICPGCRNQAGVAGGGAAAGALAALVAALVVGCGLGERQEPSAARSDTAYWMPHAVKSGQLPCPSLNSSCLMRGDAAAVLEGG